MRLTGGSGNNGTQMGVRNGGFVAVGMVMW